MAFSWWSSIYRWGMERTRIIKESPQNFLELWKRRKPLWIVAGGPGIEPGFSEPKTYPTYLWYRMILWDRGSLFPYQYRSFVLFMNDCEWSRRVWNRDQNRDRTWSNTVLTSHSLNYPSKLYHTPSPPIGRPPVRVEEYGSHAFTARPNIFLGLLPGSYFSDSMPTVRILAKLSLCVNPLPAHVPSLKSIS